MGYLYINRVLHSKGSNQREAVKVQDHCVNGVVRRGRRGWCLLINGGQMRGNQ